MTGQGTLCVRCTINFKSRLPSAPPSALEIVAEERRRQVTDGGSDLDGRITELARAGALVLAEIDRLIATEHER